MKFNEKIKGRVSIILPTYNRSAFLSKSIEKIFKNKYNDLELIIINDGSSDDTQNLLNQYKQDNIKIINLSKNSGTVCIPRNIGISHSTGEFISHADDDVVPAPDKFEILVDALNKKGNEDCVLVYGNRVNRYINKPDTYHVIPRWNPLLSTGVDNGDFIYKSNVYDIIPYVWVYRACDYELAKKIYTLGRFLHIDKHVSTYIWHGNNRSIITDNVFKNVNDKTIPNDIVMPYLKYMRNNINPSTNH